MTNLLFSFHRIAATRGEGLRSEFFKRHAGHDAELRRLYRYAGMDLADRADAEPRVRTMKA